jgi:hypothetical protein
VRDGGAVFEVHETVDGWQLEAAADTPDVGSPAMRSWSKRQRQGLPGPRGCDE